MNSIVENIKTTFYRLVAGEEFDLYEAGISSDFEGIAQWLFNGIRPHIWYDGVSGLNARRRKAQQIEFSGEMWVADDRDSKQWLEPFSARLTDMQVTKQGLMVSMHIGEYHTEGNLLTYPDAHP